MRGRRFSFAAGAIVLACASAQAAEAGDAPAANVPPPEGPAWLQPVAGVRLIAVDGSTMTLSPTEGGFALALAAPNGAAQRSSFAFMSDKLGTISDDADTGHVVGFFRETDTGIEAQYSDGRTQSLNANNAGGISLTQHAATGEASCVSWYPSDHVFGTSEKRAALAAYADRLGIADRPKKGAKAPAPACAPAVKLARKQTASTATPLASPSVSPLAATPPAAGPYKIGMYRGAAVTNSGAAGLTPVAVRTSEVHLIDGAVAAPLAAISPPAATTPPAAPVVQPAVAMAAATAPQPTQVTLASAVPDGHGASSCLSIESNGADIGFRNQCAYGVQFAYCIQKAGDPANDCGTGAKPGSVSANGFVLLLTDPNIRTSGGERDFRWVACSGSAASVVAHLDRADPPAGRCTRLGAS
ncbi:MAG TPA: hypothetical protein VG889_02755 [Rhizomicrobium sp.]|nr:hypothetical protein [Rhizomicrobium sp.]